MTSRVWLDDDGRTLREEGPMGLVALREQASEALSGGWEGEAAFDLTNAIAIPVKKPLPEPRSLDQLAVRIDGLGDLALADDERQHYHDGVLRIAREKLGETGSYTLPYRDERWRGELAATPFLQIDDPSVHRTSAEALGDETNPRRAAERLRRWVYDSLDKVPTASIPNAVQVLEMRAGDCNEHAVLFAALARAAGLPARVVAGVVYLDGAFLYHAWNEVWLGDGWVSVDAALDQMPADATHIKLLTGGPETHATLAAVVGRLSIEVLADQDPKA
jgi:transglutaminase-like putative cysteine protease